MLPSEVELGVTEGNSMSFRFPYQSQHGPLNDANWYSQFWYLLGKIEKQDDVQTANDARRAAMLKERQPSDADEWMDEWLAHVVEAEAEWVRALIADASSGPTPTSPKQLPLFSRELICWQVTGEPPDPQGVG